VSLFLLSFSFFLFPLGSVFARCRGAAYGNVERMRTEGRWNICYALVECSFAVFAEGSDRERKRDNEREREREREREKRNGKESRRRKPRPNGTEEKEETQREQKRERERGGRGGREREGGERENAKRFGGPGEAGQWKDRAAIVQPFSKTKPDSHLDLSLTPAVLHSAYNLDQASRSRRAW